MTPEVAIEKLARLYDDLQHAQNPAWIRPTDEEICDVLKEVLNTIDIDLIQDFDRKKQELEDKLSQISDYVSDIRRYCDYIEDEVLY